MPFLIDRECQRKDFSATRHKIECRHLKESQRLGFHGKYLNKLLLLMKTGKALLDESRGHNLQDECHFKDNIFFCGLCYAGSLGAFNGKFRRESAATNFELINATTTTAGKPSLDES